MADFRAALSSRKAQFVGVALVAIGFFGAIAFQFLIDRRLSVAFEDVYRHAMILALVAGGLCLMKPVSNRELYAALLGTLMLGYGVFTGVDYYRQQRNANGVKAAVALIFAKLHSNSAISASDLDSLPLGDRRAVFDIVADYANAVVTSVIPARLAFDKLPVHKIERAQELNAEDRSSLLVLVESVRAQSEAAVATYDRATKNLLSATLALPADDFTRGVIQSYREKLPSTAAAVDDMLTTRMSLLTDFADELRFFQDPNTAFELRDKTIVFHVSGNQARYKDIMERMGNDVDRVNKATKAVREIDANATAKLDDFEKM
jgi:hypothetical protein